MNKHSFKFKLITAFTVGILFSFVTINYGLAIKDALFAQSTPVEVREEIVLPPTGWISRSDVMVQNVNEIVVRLVYSPVVIGDKSYYTVRVVGSSMSPTMNDGAYAIAVKVDVAKIDVGNIIVYKHLDGGYVTHRLVDVRRDVSGWIGTTKGDNNWDVDILPIREKDVVGVVVGVLYMKP